MENKINEILEKAKSALPAAKTKTEVAEISTKRKGRLSESL